MANIIKIQAQKQTSQMNKRVAAYARVSMESDNLIRSFSNQVSSYSKLIQSRADWEFAGVYADKGITGTSTTHRKEFNRMVSDCEDGKIDMIITKSVSRFARNTVDLLQTVRHLKSLSVDVYFEEQNIHSLSGDGELMLTLLAALAQEESQSIKNNVEWLIQKKFEQGLPNGYKRMLGYDWDGEQYVVVPKEAETVKRIFNLYLDGNSSVKIAQILNEEGKTTILGKPFTDDAVRFILGNENYTGDLILQKRYSPSPRKRAINHGEVPMYRVEEDHEPIVSIDDFNRVQQIRRQKQLSTPEKNVTCFSGKLKCGYCGSSVCRKNVTQKAPTWICNAVDKKGRSSCKSTRRLAEAELIELVKAVLGEDYEENIRYKVESITVYDDKVVFSLSNGRSRTLERHFSSKPHEKGCLTKKVYCGECGRPFTRRYVGKNNYAVWRYRGTEASDCCHPIREEELREAVRSVFGSRDNYDMRFYCETDRLLVYNDRLEFVYKDGGIIRWQRK